MEKVAKLGDLAADRGLKVEVANTKILLVRDGETVRAYAAECPHAQAPLEEGAICHGRLICPWHKAVFRVSDGALLEPPALDPLTRYPVRIEGEDIFVGADAIPAPEPKPAKDDRTFLIAGAGAAGATAAAALREFGFGGRILLVGREPGQPFDRTSLSKFVVAGHMRPEDAPPLRPSEFYSKHGIERIDAEVASFDGAKSEVVLGDGRTLSYDSALIATGSEPVKPNIPGDDLMGVHALRSREDAAAILADTRKGAAAVILGSSFIGLEVACGLREQGVEVSIVSPDSIPFSRQFGKRIGASIQAMHEAHGVVFHLEAKPVRLEGEKRVEAVVLEDGRRLPADLVIAAVGVRPATPFVRGVQPMKDGGLPVDANLRVIANVYAAGDIAAFPAAPDGERQRIEHWRVAQQQARIAARNMLGAKVAYDSTPFFWTYHYGKNFEYLGHAQHWDEEIIIGDLEANKFVALLLQSKRVAAVVACQNERTTATLVERMQKPLFADEARQLIASTGSNLEG